MRGTMHLSGAVQCDHWPVPRSESKQIVLACAKSAVRLRDWASESSLAEHQIGTGTNSRGPNEASRLLSSASSENGSSLMVHSARQPHAPIAVAVTLSSQQMSSLPAK